MYCTEKFDKICQTEMTLYDNKNNNINQLDLTVRMQLDFMILTNAKQNFRIKTNGNFIIIIIIITIAYDKVDAIDGNDCNMVE